VAVWLIALATLVFLMVVIGGITRLTESGLSIVEWRPVSGALPPLSEAAWEAEFAKYRTSPQFRAVNSAMTLADFKTIFWWEYVHRLWGRLIGLAFAIPFAVFLWRGAIPAGYARPLWVVFALGAAQGALGWFMVASGLVDRPSVSQYRLVAHLGLALAIHAALVWLALDLLRLARCGGDAPGRPSDPAAARRAAWLVGLIGLTAASGGFVAGLDAGLAYNTFPLMDGRLVPEGYLTLAPWWANAFENTAAVQFNHRVLAVATVALVLAFALWTAGRPLAPRARIAVGALAAMAVAQAGLGVLTLLHEVPVALGAAHQAGAVVLLTLALWARHALLRG